MESDHRSVVTHFMSPGAKTSDSQSESKRKKAPQMSIRSVNRAGSTQGPGRSSLEAAAAAHVKKESAAAKSQGETMQKEEEATAAKLQNEPLEKESAAAKETKGAAAAKTHDDSMQK